LPSSWFYIQPKINAFALPSKDIFVYAGLVDLVDDDTLLAAVLAHEIAHVTQRHAVENVSPLIYRRESQVDWGMGCANEFICVYSSSAFTR
jgi:predicted Zn-dependent protease